MVYQDLREWIDLLRSEGELAEIEAEVDWNREIATISRKVTSKEGPALFFSNIKDYKDGDFSRLFSGGLAEYLGKFLADNSLRTDRAIHVIGQAHDVLVHAIFLG